MQLLSDTLCGEFIEVTIEVLYWQYFQLLNYIFKRVV